MHLARAWSGKIRGLWCPGNISRTDRKQVRSAIEALKGQPTGSAFNADVGVELPPAVELRPVPAELAARVPQTRDYSYAATADRVLLVSTSRIVTGVFADANVPMSEGRRGP